MSNKEISPRRPRSPGEHKALVAVKPPVASSPKGKSQSNGLASEPARGATAGSGSRPSWPQLLS